MRFNGIQNCVAHLADQIILSGSVKQVYYIYLFFDMGLKAHTQTPIFGGSAVESADSNAEAAESDDSTADSPPTHMWVSNRRRTLPRVGRLSLLNMFNISPPTESPNGNRPIPDGNRRWESADCRRLTVIRSSWYRQNGLSPANEVPILAGDWK